MTTGRIDESSGAADAAPEPPPPLVAPPRSLLRNIGAMLGGQATTWLITLVVTVIVPRRVGSESLGGLGTAVSAWTIAGMAMAFGTTTLVTLDVAHHQDDRSVHLGPVVVARLFGFVLAVPIVAGYVWVAGFDDDVVVLFVIIAASTLTASIAEVAAAALTGLEQLAPVAASDVINKLVGAVLVIAVVVVTDDVRLVAIVSVASASASLIWLWWSLRRRKPVDVRVTRRDLREVIRRGSPYWVIGLTLVAYNQVDMTVISLLVSKTEAGWYRSADQLFGTLLFVPMIVITSMLPTLARRNAEDPAHATRTLVQVFMTVSLVSVPIGLGTFVIAGPLAPLLWGQEFEQAGSVLAVYGIVLMVTFQTILLGQHALATGRVKLWNVVLGVCIPLTIVFDLIFVPIFHDRYGNGAIAGALAYIITEGLMVVVGVWKLAPELLSSPVRRRAVKTLAAGGVLVAWSWPLRDEFILIPIAAGAVGYVVALCLLRPLEAHEKVLVNRVAGRVPFVHRLLG